MKRNLGQEQFITSKKILEVMGGATGEIAAIFVNFKEVDGKRVATTMQYFDRQTLRAFLYVHDSNRNGILQKFVSIKQQIYGSASTTNQTLHTLHVTWKKGALRSTTVVQRSHALRIVEPKNGIDDGNDEENGNDDRRTSYLYAIAEALPYGQITLPLQSHLSKNIREACERLAKHVETVTDHAVRITRMVCYFKVGHKGQLWFNFPTSIDVDDSGIDHTFDLPVNMPSHAHAPRAPPTAHREEIYTADEPGTRSRDDTSSSAHMVALKTLDKSDREFELKNKAYLIPCCFCAETVESMMSCNITIRETISFLEQNYSESIEMTQKEPTGKRLETTQEGLHTPAERALRIWSDMRLTEGDEITLPELRWRMKQLQLPFHIVEKIETGLAYADTEILGVIDFNLWSTGVAYSAEQEKSQSARKEASRHSFAGNVITPRGTGAPSSPTFLAGTKEPQSPDTTPDTTQELLQAIMSGTRDFDSVLRAGTGRRKALEPLLIKNLRSNLYPKLFVRMTTRGALDRESSEFLERNVDVCSDCHKSVKWFLLQRGAPYWDAQLEKILQPVPGTAPQMTSRSPKTHRPITLIDRMWSRSMEMTKAGTFPVLQPLGYAQGNVVRANENDLAWSNRTNTAGGSPRSPPGRKPITASPRSRAVTNFRTPSGENGGVLVQSGNVVKTPHISPSLCIGSDIVLYANAV